MSGGVYWACVTSIHKVYVCGIVFEVVPHVEGEREPDTLGHCSDLSNMRTV